MLRVYKYCYYAVYEILVHFGPTSRLILASNQRFEASCNGCNSPLLSPKVIQLHCICKES